MNIAPKTVIFPHKPIKLNPTAVARFWSKVAKTNDCWNWIAGGDQLGYGHFWLNRKNALAARVSWVIHFGEIPTGPNGIGLFVCHHCDNPRCVRPDHLFLGTAKDNMLDKEAKGRGNQASGIRNGSKTHPERVARGERSGGAKLSEKHVIEIRKRCLLGATQTETAFEFNIDQSTVSYIVRRKTWTHI